MDVTIETASNTPCEAATATELTQVVTAYDLHGLRWTDRVEHWPSTPSSEGGGARSETSTRLHFFVCYLEHRAMHLLTTPDRANIVIRDQIEVRIHPWIRQQVLEHRDVIGDLCDRHELWPRRLQANG